MYNSYFDGGLAQLVFYRVIGYFITLFTLGFGYPIAVVMVYKWEITHTVINGHRLEFDGTAGSLFAHWIKWFFLMIITFGIYGFWIQIKIKQWKAKHTYFVN